MTALTALPAREALGLLRRGEVTAAELRAAVASRMAAVEPTVNAVPIVALEGVAGGLPITVKDVVDVAGLPTTYGSSPWRDNVATRSDPLVRRLEGHGFAVVGKTNVPEWLCGAETENGLFGRTGNPDDPALTVGASSGGAAASVASGTSWLAHGEDTAGSIRIPAAFCGVVGLRTTPGLVPGANPTPDLTVHGPIARDIADAELMLRAMATAARGAATTSTRLAGGWVALRDEPPPPPPRHWVGRKVAHRYDNFSRLSTDPLETIGWSVDLGGRASVDPEIAATCARTVAALTMPVTDCTPPVDGWHEACLDLLAHRSAMLHGTTVDRYGDRIGPAVHAEVEAGRSLPAARVAAALRVREKAMRTDLFAGFDVLMTPTFGIPPWKSPPDLTAVAASWPLTTLATMAGCPALTVPCGRNAGLQLVGPPGSDLALLELGARVEAVATC